MRPRFCPLSARPAGLSLWLFFFAAIAISRAETLVDQLLAPYDAVTTVVCQVRKETASPAGSIRTLSRVYYAKTDRLHVENVSPVKRRIVCDGRTFYSYIEGDPKGFSRPVADLDEEMSIQLRKVPGTAMDHLFRLRNLPEKPLDGTPEFPTRAVYHNERQWIVLSVDATGRLAQIEFFDEEACSHKVAEYRFDQFKEVLPGVWIPLLHQVWLDSGGVVTRETTRIDHIEVNVPAAENLFVPGLYFKDVKFVDSFQKIYQ
jgi:hypothetical protein